MIRCILIAAALAFGEKPLYLSAKTTGDAILVIVQGQGISNQQYADLGKQIQSSNTGLHVVVPDFGNSFADVHKVINGMKATIPNADNLPTFIAGHSAGAVAALKEVSAYPKSYKAALLFGNSLARNYSSTFPVPVLAVNGELDGYHRISRVAEHFFNRYDRKKIDITVDSVVNQPIVMIEGMTHMQFAPGSVPGQIKNLDLKAEISDSAARVKIAKVVSDFICIQGGNSGCDQSAATTALVAAVQNSRNLIDPMIQAFKMESSPNLFTACNSDTPSAHCPFYPAWPPNDNRPTLPASDCVCGVPFSDIAVNIMANLDPKTYPLVNVDAIHFEKDTKSPHHAHIWSNCTAAANPTFPCVMNCTTVSRPMYEEDPDDTGLPHATAYEIQVRMKARQAFARFSYDPNAKLDVLDKPSICADINQKSYEWALSTASAKTRARFEQFGQKVVVATPDRTPALPIGVLYTNDNLAITDEKVDGKWVLKVSASTFKTPEEGSLATNVYPDSNGYHYCKVFSPARAMEHIYVDGLRKYMGLQ